MPLNNDETIDVRTRDGAAEHCFSYRVATCTLRSDRPLAPSMIREALALAPPGPLAAYHDSELSDPQWRKRGTYLIGGRQRIVCCASSGHCSQIDIAGIGRLHIRHGGRSISFSNGMSTAGEPTADPLIDNGADHQGHGHGDAIVDQQQQVSSGNKGPVGA